MEEQWLLIKNFEDYSVSDFGRVRTNKTERILSVYANQSGLVHVGLMQNGRQKHRSVPLLVAKAFVPQPSDIFDTPINLDGDRFNNHVSNLIWRPRWFAIKYHQQFKFVYDDSINAPIQDVKSGEISLNSLECAKTYGLLEREILISVMTGTYVWPTYQVFQLVED